MCGELFYIFRLQGCPEWRQWACRRSAFDSRTSVCESARWAGMTQMSCANTVGAADFNSHCHFPPEVGSTRFQEGTRLFRMAKRMVKTTNENPAANASRW